MKKRLSNLAAFTAFCFLLLPLEPQAAISARAPRAMVATAHPLATEAALNILKKGGNAADAAIAAQWVLNVVEPQSSGIGGGGFFLFYDAKTKRVYCLDGRETAPRDATPDMFLDSTGNPFIFSPDRNTGGLPVGVPGTLRLLKVAHERFASKQFSFESLFQPAINIAEKGFLVSSRFARMIDGQKERLRLFPESKRIFLNQEGQALEPGTLLQQPDLAKTFKLLQENGIAFFYEGELADAIVNTVRFAPFHPGRLTRQDLFYYTVKEREGVYGRYRDYDLLSMGPPSSGGVTLMEALNILSNFDLGRMS
ncbi:MAG: gamma-glutamyltransferase, partial [Candidatus Omnitrophica bacterium]|nr:gamma-glutamyltransferase [Candidatus Omnitrophota bacterium]